MNDLKAYLEKFKTKFKDPKEERSAICAAVKKASAIELSDEQVKMQNGTLYVKADSLTKNAVFLNRKKILEELQMLLGAKAPKNIR